MTTKHPRPSASQLALKPGASITYKGRRHTLKAVTEYNSSWRAWIGTRKTVPLRDCQPV